MPYRVMLAVFSILALPGYAAIIPSMSIKKDPVCEVYSNAYIAKLKTENAPSFQTEEILSHDDGSSYLPSDEHSIPITFSQPFVSDGATWLTWFPVAQVEHSFKWGGLATNVTAIGSIKPSPNTSFIFQVNTVGWRGPYYRVWEVKDEQLQKIISQLKSKAKVIPFEGSGVRLIFPELKEVFSSHFTNLFQFDNNFYIASDDKVTRITSGKSEVVCQFGLESGFSSPQITALEDAANKALMTSGVTHIPMYYGTMGNPHRPVEHGFDVAINKPWLLKVSENGHCLKTDKIDNCEKNKRVEAVLDMFAQSDPWSYREIAAIRYHMEGAKYVLAQYYIKELQLDPKISNAMAEQAIYDFLEKTVYLHPYIRNGIEYKDGEQMLYMLDEPDGNIAPNWYNKTALMWAAHFNDIDATKRLLSNPSLLKDVTRSSEQYASIEQLNRSALSYAVENGTVPLILSLLAAGADVNIKDSKGNSIESYYEKNQTLDVPWQELMDSDMPPISPSFNCNLAKNRLEKTICASEGLSVYDQQLGALYTKVTATNNFPEIQVLQTMWLQSLQQECTGDGNQLAKCLKMKYRARIKYLANLMVSKNDSVK